MGRSRSRSSSASSSDRRRRRRRERSRSRSVEIEGTRLHIGELSSHTKKSDLEDAFSKYGSIREVWMAQVPPCFAFVIFKRPEDAQEACHKLNGATVGGGRIRVSIALPRSRQRHQMRGTMRPFNADMRCYQCGQKGHFARECIGIGRHRNTLSPRRHISPSSSSGSSSPSRSRSRSRGERRSGRRHSSRERHRSRDRGNGDRHRRSLDEKERKSGNGQRDKRASRERSKDRSSVRDKHHERSPRRSAGRHESQPTADDILAANNNSPKH